jgi:hypothetical protein
MRVFKYATHLNNSVSTLSIINSLQSSQSTILCSPYIFLCLHTQMTVDVKPKHTFSDSPWFWDGSSSSLPQHEENVVQVSDPLNAHFSTHLLTDLGPFQKEGRVLSSKRCGKLSLWSEYERRYWETGTARSRQTMLTNRKNTRCVHTVSN